jgi:hypothetical protein
MALSPKQNASKFRVVHYFSVTTMKNYPSMQDGMPPHVARLVGGLGVEDEQNGLREGCILLNVISFSGVRPKKKSADQNQEHLVNSEGQIRNTFVAVILDFSRQSVRACLQGCTKWLRLGFKTMQEF